MAIEYLKEKILNDVKQQFSQSNQEDKINAELAENVRGQMEDLQSEMCFLRQEMKEKNTLLKIIIHLKGSPQELTFSSPIYRQYQSKNASKNAPFLKQNWPESPQEQSTNE